MRLRRALDHLDELGDILAGERVGLFTDFDGTLTPIFDDPRDSVLAPAIRDALRALSERLDLVVVSGRGVDFLSAAVGLPGVTYVGNHGLEVRAAGSESAETDAEAPSGLAGEVGLQVRNLGIEGLYVEDKGMSVAVHYRNTPDPSTARAKVWEMLRPLAEARGLALKQGKMVLEAAPKADVNKGTAVRTLVRGAALTGAIALGDDVTDCDAFDAVHDGALGEGFRGAAIAVVDGETPQIVLQKSDYRLSGRGEVEDFLAWMAYESPRSARKP